MDKAVYDFLKVLVVIAVLGVAAYLVYPFLQEYLKPSVTPTDPYGLQFEKLNADIASAKSAAQLGRLYANASALKAQVAKTNYTKYLALADSQLEAIQVLNASLLHSAEASAYSSSGIDCSRDYSDVQSTLRAANATRKSAVSGINSYISAQPNTTAKLLLTELSKVDTEGMHLFAELLGDEFGYYCLVTETPVKKYTLPLNESEATSLVVDEVVGSEGWIVYSAGEKLKKGSVVAVRDPSGDWTNRTIGSETWFFFLDKTPGAHFSHPVKFVYVDAASGNYTVSDEVFNPVIDGIDYWYSMESRLNDSWIVYPLNVSLYKNVTINLSSKTFVDGRLYSFPLAIASVPAGTPCDSIDCCEGVGEDMGLVVNGDDQDFFHTDTKNMYDFMKKEMGMAAGDITYLTAKAGVSESDGVTTMESFKKALSKLANETECCDRLFIYITGHGTNVSFWEYKETGTGKIMRFTRKKALTLDPKKWNYTGWVYRYHIIDMNPEKKEKKPDGSTVTTGSKDGGYMWAEDIASMLDKIKSCYVTVMYDSCHSGYAAPWLAGKGRTIITTSNKGSSYVYPQKGLGGIFNTLYMMAHNVFKGSADKNNDGKVSHKEAFDYANKYTDGVSKAHHGESQSGTYTPPKPPCECCDVKCNKSTDYYCVVVEGNGTVDPVCKKVGDYCGPTVTSVPNITENITTPNITGNGTPGTGGGTTVGGGGIVNVTCGDGIKATTEECENDSDCPKYRYCDKKTCSCKQYPLICGDGKIAAGEACDPKASPTGCSQGLRCGNDCTCVQPSAVCGDGIVGGLEECDTGFSCADSSERCNLNTCQCEAATGNDTTEGYCGDGIVQGGESCEQASDCSSGHLCSACSCIKITVTYCGDGNITGSEECDPNASPTGCSSGQACGSLCKCVDPPSLDCETICGYTSGAQSFGGGYGSSQECGSAVKSYYGTKTCYLVCSYSWYYSVSNIAGTASCCCGMKKEFACSDCPGQNPQCPGQDTCDANAPTWYVPS